MSNITCQNTEANILVKEDLLYSTRLLAKSVAQLLIEEDALAFKKGDKALLTIHFTVHDGIVHVKSVEDECLKSDLDHAGIPHLVNHLFDEVIRQCEIDGNGKGMLELKILFDADFVDEISLEISSEDDFVQFTGEGNVTIVTDSYVPARRFVGDPEDFEDLFDEEVDDDYGEEIEQDDENEDEPEKDEELW